MPLPAILHRRVLRFAASLGPNHAAVKYWLQRSCRRFDCTLQMTPYVWALRKHNRVIRIAPRQFRSIPYFARRFDHYFDSIVPETKGAESVLDFSRVHLSTYRKSGLTFEFSSAPDEEDTLDSWFHHYRPAPHDLVFDLGAHCGVSTYVLSRFSARVIAFESDALSSAVLQRNVGRHQLSNVTVVKQIPELAEAFSRWGTPAYCKIDLPGGEFDLLEPALAELKNTPVHLAIRTVHHSSGIDNQAKVEQLLSTRFTLNSHPELGITWAVPK